MPFFTGPKDPPKDKTKRRPSILAWFAVAGCQARVFILADARVLGSWRCGYCFGIDVIIMLFIK